MHGWSGKEELDEVEKDVQAKGQQKPKCKGARRGDACAVNDKPLAVAGAGSGGRGGEAAQLASHRAGGRDRESLERRAEGPGLLLKTAGAAQVL